MSIYVDHLGYIPLSVAALVHEPMVGNKRLNWLSRTASMHGDWGPNIYGGRRHITVRQSAIAPQHAEGICAGNYIAYKVVRVAICVPSHELIDQFPLEDESGWRAKEIWGAVQVKHIIAKQVKVTLRHAVSQVARYQVIQGSRHTDEFLTEFSPYLPHALGSATIN